MSYKPPHEKDWRVAPRGKQTEMLFLDLLTSETGRDIEAELENLLDNGFSREEALKMLKVK